MSNNNGSKWFGVGGECKIRESHEFVMDDDYLFLVGEREGDGREREGDAGFHSNCTKYWKKKDKCRHF